MFGNIFERRMYLDKVQCSWFYLRNSGNILIWEPMSNIPFIFISTSPSSTCFGAVRPSNSKLVKYWRQKEKSTPTPLTVLPYSALHHSLSLSLSPSLSPRMTDIWSSRWAGRIIPSNSQQVPPSSPGLPLTLYDRKRRNGQWIGMSEWGDVTWCLAGPHHQTAFCLLFWLGCEHNLPYVGPGRGYQALVSSWSTWTPANLEIFSTTGLTFIKHLPVSLHLQSTLIELLVVYISSVNLCNNW